MKRKLRINFRAARRNLFWVAVGFLLALTFRFYLRDHYEASMFQSLATAVRKDNPSAGQETLALAAMHVAHNLLTTRVSLFGHINAADDDFEGSLTDDLLSAKGACGSYSAVLAQLLQSLGFEVRIAQMKVRGRYGGHINVEARTIYGWVVLDPQFDCCFRKPSGQLASFEDVSENWAFYQLQTPPGYNPAYAYADVRYTNWNKIPVLLPALRKCLTLFLGEARVRNISVAPLLLRRYRVYSLLLGLATLVLIGVRYRPQLRLRRRPVARPQAALTTA
ncbi:MAG TPA: transglutaminase domain-containing protein [Puia sp.]|nr:transglutaminase domain-containing protein [Puia sp.]